MGMEIITGYTGTPHVTSEQGGAENAGIVGGGRYVFNLGEKFAYEVISNNLIRIKNGYGINQGRTFGIKTSDYEELVIDNGLAGVSRHDLVVARYEKIVETGIESISLVVIKGTSSTTPVDPSYTTGDILSGAIIDDYPLYRIVIDGLSVASVIQLFEVSTPTMEIPNTIGTLSSLTTGIKTTIVNAINWLHEKLLYAVASDYSASNTYVLGEYHFYDKILYKCSTAITIPEAWNASHWTAVRLANEVKSANDNIATINTKLAIEKNKSVKNVILIGDSYGINYSGGWTGWTNEFTTLFSGYTVYKSAVGGSGFIGDTGVNDFLEQLQSLAGSITDKNSITDIVVLGGYNDVSTGQTLSAIKTAITNFKTYAVANYPYAKISVGFVGFDSRLNGMQTNMTVGAINYRSACNSNGITFIENMQFSLLNRDYIFLSTTDANSGFHPNTAGCQYLATLLNNYLCNGVVHVIHSETVFGMNVYSMDGIITVFPTSTYGYFASQLTALGTLAFNTWTNLTTLVTATTTTSKLLWGTVNASTCFMFYADVYVDTVNKGFYQFRILNGVLQIKDVGHTSGTTMTSNCAMAVPTLTIPTYALY